MFFFLSEHQVILWNLWNLFQFLENWLTYGPKWWVFPRKILQKQWVVFCVFSTRNYRLSQPRVGLIFFRKPKKDALWSLANVFKTLRAAWMISGIRYERMNRYEQPVEVWWLGWYLVDFMYLYYYIIYLICVDVSYMELKRLLFNDWCLNMFFFFLFRVSVLAQQ